MAANVVAEIPIFANSELLLRRLGHDMMVVTALLLYTVRVYGYTMLTAESVQWLAGLEMLHGFTFALSWIAGVDYIKEAFPAELSTTAQLIFRVFKDNIGAMIGALLGSAVFQRGSVFGYTGGRALYMGTSVCAASLLICHSATSAMLLCSGRRCLLTPRSRTSKTPPIQ